MFKCNKPFVKILSITLVICLVMCGMQIQNIFALGYKPNSADSGAIFEPGDILTAGDNYIADTFIDNNGDTCNYSDYIYLYEDSTDCSSLDNHLENSDLTISGLGMYPSSSGKVSVDDCYIIDYIANMDRCYMPIEVNCDYYKYNTETGVTTRMEVIADAYGNISSIEGKPAWIFTTEANTFYYGIKYVNQYGYKYFVEAWDFVNYRSFETAGEFSMQTYSKRSDSYTNRPVEYLAYLPELFDDSTDSKIPIEDEYVICDGCGYAVIYDFRNNKSNPETVNSIFNNYMVDRAYVTYSWENVGVVNDELSNDSYVYYDYTNVIVDTENLPLVSNPQTVIRVSKVPQNVIVKADLNIGDTLVGGNTYLLLYMMNDEENADFDYNFNYQDGTALSLSPNDFNFSGLSIPFCRNISMSKEFAEYIFQSGDMTYYSSTNTTDTKIDHSNSYSSFADMVNNSSYYQCGLIVTVPGDSSSIWTYSGSSTNAYSSNFDDKLTYNFTCNKIYVQLKDYITDEIIDIKTFDRDADITNIELDGYYGFYDSNLNSVDVSSITDNTTLYTLPVSIDMNVYNASTYNMYNSNIAADSVGKFTLNNTESSVLQYSFVRPENISEEDYPVLSVITDSYNTTYYGQNIDGIKPSLLKSIYSRVHYCISNGYNAGVLAFPSKVYAKFYDGVTGYQINTNSYVNAGGFWQITNISDFDIPNINDANIDNHVVLSQVPNFTTQLHLSSDMSSEYPYMICRIDDITEDDLEVFDTMEISDYENLCSDDVDIYCGILEERLATCINAAEETYNITKIRGQQKRATFDSFVTASNPGIDNQLRKFPTFDASLPYTTYNTTNPISGMAYMSTASIHLKSISTFAELKDADGYYTELYCMDYYGKLAFAIVPSDTSITIYHGSATNNYDESHADTFTSVDDYNNFLNETNEQYGFTYVTLQRELSKDTNNNALKTALFVSTGADDSFVTNYSKETNPAYFHGTACFYVSYSKTMLHPAFGHLWNDEWTEIGKKEDLVNEANFQFITAINNNVVDEDTLFAHAENTDASTLQGLLDDSNNSLYGKLCSRASDAYELRVGHEHSYDSPTFTWSTDYTECEASFECTSGDDSQVLDCTVTSDSTDPTCTASGNYKYTASVTFNGNTYTDIVTIPRESLGHEYGTPTFIWDSMYSSCVVVFSCIRGDDTQRLDCTVNHTNTPATYFEEGEDKYVATITFNGNNYQDTKTVQIPMLVDNIMPSITVNVADNTWRSFLNTITFNLFFKDYQTCTVDAVDNESELNSVQYYLSSTVLTEEEVRALTNWIDYNESFSINPTAKYIVYVKAKDNVGNVSYASSDGMIFDNVKPTVELSNTDDVILASSVIIQAEDNMALESVVVDDVQQTVETETATSFTLFNDATLDQEKQHLIKVTDKAGNSTEVTITFGKTDMTANVTGYVKDLAGNPISGVVVKLHSNPREATTDSNGEFLFENVEVDNHTLEAYNGNDKIFEVSMTLMPTYVETETVYMNNSFSVTSNYTLSSTELTVMVNADECENHIHGREERENVTDATCVLSGGYDLVSYCPNCGGEYSRRHEFTDPLGHTWVDDSWVLIESSEVTEDLINGAENDVQFSDITSDTKVYKRLCSRASDAYEIKLVTEPTPDTPTDTPTDPDPEPEKTPDTSTDPEPEQKPDTPTDPTPAPEPEKTPTDSTPAPEPEQNVPITDISTPYQIVKETPTVDATDAPKTGDTSQLTFVIILLLLSMLLLSGSTFILKKRDK